MGQLEELAGSMLQTRPFSYSDESVTLADNVVDAFAASFAALRISDAFVADEYPSEVLSYSDSPLSLGGGVSAGAMDIHVEVFVTGDGASSSSSKTRKAAEARAAADRIESSDPLRAVMQSLRIPIGTDVDATNVAEARTQLEERRQQMLDLSETLAATQRRLDAAQLERDAAYGFTPAAAEPSRVADVRARGGAIGRALGAVPTVYETPAKNMRAAQAAAVGLDQLAGEELKERIGRMRELLHAANTQQDRLNQLDKPAGSGSARLGGPGELLHTASSPPGEAHSGQAWTRRNRAAAATDVLGNEPILGA